MKNNQNRNHIVALLRQGHWFGRLPEALQQQIVESSTLHRFAARQTISHQGQPLAGLWAVLQGQVLISESLADGSDFLAQVAGPGYWFEYAGLLLGQPAVFRVAANTQVRAMLLPAAALQRILEEDPGSYRHFAAPALERYRAVTHLVALSFSLDPEAFFQVRLALMINRWRLDGYREPVIEVELSQSAAARMLGLSRQTLNRYLARLEEEGLIETSFRSIRILQPDLICARAASL